MNKGTPKSCYYDYTFNYFGEGRFKGNLIGGACVQIAIRVYKDGHEIKFTEEPSAIREDDIILVSLSELVSVSFDRENLYKINNNPDVAFVFCKEYGYDMIKFEVVGYTLDKYTELTEEERKELPEELLHLPCLEPIEVSKEEFEAFLREHIDDFDISDNINAQVPSFGFIELP